MTCPIEDQNIYQSHTQTDTTIFLQGILYCGKKQKREKTGSKFAIGVLTETVERINKYKKIKNKKIMLCDQAET